MKSAEMNPVIGPLEAASNACPFGGLLDILGKPHTLEILYTVGSNSPQRFSQIQKDLRLRPKTLTARLQELVKFGLLTRKSYDEIPPRVDYEISKKGRELGKMFDEMRAWYKKYGDVGNHQTKDQRPGTNSKVSRV